MNNPKVNVVVSGHRNEYHSTYNTYILKGYIPFADQVIIPDTKYVIKYDFDLGGGASDIDFSNADTHTVAEVTYYYIPFIADGSKYTLIDDTLVFIDAEWNGLSAREIKPAKGTLFLIASITGGLHKNGYSINVVTVPENCILEFDGGSLSNGNLVLNNTYIEGIHNCLDVILSGSCNNDIFEVDWFRIDKTGTNVCTNAIQSIANIGCREIHFGIGTYTFHSVSVTHDCVISGSGNKSTVLLAQPRVAGSTGIDHLFVFNKAGEELGSAKVKDLQVIGDTTELTQTNLVNFALFSFKNMKNVLFDNVYFNKCHFLKHSGGKDQEVTRRGDVVSLVLCVDVNNVVIKNCEIDDCYGGEQIYVDYTDKDRRDVNTSIINNYVHDITSVGNSPFTIFGNNIIVEHNEVDNFTVNVSVFNLFGNNVYINDNVVRNSNSSSVFDASEYGRNSNETVCCTNNIVECENSTMLICSSFGLKVSNNTFKGITLVLSLLGSSIQEYTDGETKNNIYEEDFVTKAVIEDNIADCTYYNTDFIVQLNKNVRKLKSGICISVVHCIPQIVIRNNNIKYLCKEGLMDDLFTETEQTYRTLTHIILYGRAMQTTGITIEDNHFDGEYSNVPTSSSYKTPVCVAFNNGGAGHHSIINVDNVSFNRNNVCYVEENVLNVDNLYPICFAVDSPRYVQINTFNTFGNIACKEDNEGHSLDENNKRFPDVNGCVSIGNRVVIGYLNANGEQAKTNASVYDVSGAYYTNTFNALPKIPIFKTFMSRNLCLYAYKSTCVGGKSYDDNLRIGRGDIIILQHSSSTYIFQYINIMGQPQAIEPDNILAKDFVDLFDDVAWNTPVETLFVVGDNLRGYALWRRTSGSYNDAVEKKDIPFGVTASRPTTAYHQGANFFDTTIKKPIFVQAINASNEVTKWIEADGCLAGVPRRGSFNRRPMATDIIDGFRFLCLSAINVGQPQAALYANGGEIIHTGYNGWVDVFNDVIAYGIATDIKRATMELGSGFDSSYQCVMRDKAQPNVIDKVITITPNSGYSLPSTLNDNAVKINNVAKGSSCVYSAASQDGSRTITIPASITINGLITIVLNAN